MSYVLKWNGRDLPDELKELPPGRYIIESVDRAPQLTDEQEDDLIAAIGEADAGQSVTLDEARRRIGLVLERRQSGSFPEPSLSSRPGSNRFA